MFDLVQKYSDAIGTLRRQATGTPQHLAAYTSQQNALDTIIDASGLSRSTVVAMINVSEREFNGLPQVAETVIAGSAYPDAFIQYLSERLDGAGEPA